MRMLKARQEPGRSYSGTTEQSGKYTLRIYLHVTRGTLFLETDRGYTIVAASTFLFTSIVFIVFASVVNGGNRLLWKGMINNAERLLLRNVSSTSSWLTEVKISLSSNVP
jgi:hypothetical protein